MNAIDAEWCEATAAAMREWCACTYYVFQLEKAPTTGTLHAQGYVELSTPSKLATIKRVLGRRVHVEMAIASREQNRAYCTKTEGRAEGAGAGPWEFIRNPENHELQLRGQGARSDIAAFRDAIMRGDTEIDLLAHFPELMARYPRFLDTVRRISAPRRDWRPEVIICWGDAGSGKSRYAHDQAPDAYRKADGVWWDGYAGQPDVIMDDFYGAESFPYVQFLKLVDYYDYIAPVKGAMVRVNPRRIFITSNRSPHEWYAAVPSYEQWAFFRRISRIRHYTMVLGEPVFTEIKPVGVSEHGRVMFENV